MAEGSAAEGSAPDADSLASEGPDRVSEAASANAASEGLPEGVLVKRAPRHTHAAWLNDHF
eukprot:3091212-Lingulodinium_polyedra.AAC.1